ncbi:MAG TPA: ABC transporter permease [Lachnoclostridium phytofermentans]|uniref:ABC transporter permease n=1 Tax=Lachnoclostridium phytofermentans TaxID=66219 RepID=A0A3D2X6A9_9FIRM|nr:ABC transporter permease [Lachnoclostridium sp.]HCL02095.1 ABC transporter permease [Lachnoclostridium phytofermentans]
MMNYVKSEIYRVTHSKGIYCFTAILAGLSFLLNAVLAWFGKMDGASFPYNTTSFSYSNLVANPMIFCTMGAVVGIILYEGNRKNGNLKNTIAFGIPRTKVFAGECIVAAISAIVSLIIVLAVYIVSAIILLEHTGPVNLTDLLTEIPAVFLLAVACLISGIVCIEAFGKDSTGIIVWFIIWFIIPKVFFYLGLRFDVIYNIAMWMPENFFGTSGMIVNMSQSITAWGTSEGMAKCIISGIIGIIVFSLSGVVLLRKREL